MRSKKWPGIFILLVLLGLLVFGLRYIDSSNEFVNYPLPLSEMHKIMDVGIVDANNDGLLDIYTSNHNFKQLLLIADAHGNYHDSLDEWGLNQSREFPGVELSYIAPDLDKAGLYIYWLGSGGNDKQGHNIILRTHKSGEFGSWNGTLQINAPVEIDSNDGFTIENVPQSSPRAKTTINFSTDADALLSLKLTTWGLPISFEIKGNLRSSQIYVGNKKITPQSTSFTMALQDRHGLAWADFNNDGKMDVFTNRGALGGGLSQYPESVQNTIKDVFFVSGGDGQYKEMGSELGFAKKGCSGRHLKWVDFNQDGLLDLYINCQDRGRMKRDFPKQLYQQDRQGRFTDVATEVGLGIPDQQLIDFAWLDADNDGDADLLTTEDKGFYLYRNQAGRFSREFIGRGKFAREDRRGLKHVTLDYWNFDGKLTIADYDADGDLDAFSTSKEGNTLLINNTGKYSLVDPVTIGLPARSVGGNWIDYDNDGLPDFHAVPEGLFKQHTGNLFKATDLLVLPSHKYLAAISNWADLDMYILPISCTMYIVPISCTSYPSVVHPTPQLYILPISCTSYPLVEHITPQLYILPLSCTSYPSVVHITPQLYNLPLSCTTYLSVVQCAYYPTFVNTTPQLHILLLSCTSYPSVVQCISYHSVVHPVP